MNNDELDKVVALRKLNFTWQNYFQGSHYNDTYTRLTKKYYLILTFNTSVHISLLCDMKRRIYSLSISLQTLLKMISFSK